MNHNKKKQFFINKIKFLYKLNFSYYYIIKYY